ncbi:MAG: phospho-N-acetylmuramoyl-pentapeptide-transferase [Thermoleophilia bacterium]|nr:phospho-N-acetylmuramoyl-pentapeptide-transferase [Gaiellaceae bacterium]MDW8338689.1 phospho-N-acetylmuramoyl-pentapeptide-transferase [Thermoleophilia bacterium]
MVPVLIAGLVAMIAAVVVGPKFIQALRARNLGQQIRAEGPATHVVKQGTPTMGGLLIVATATLPFLALSQYTVEALTVLFLMLSCAAIGFADDYLKLRRRRSLGLPGRWKMVGLAIVTVVAALLLQRAETFDTALYLPLVGLDVDLGVLYYPFLFLVIAGTVNGANLTDGIDGLAAGVTTIMLLTFLAIAGISWLRSGAPGERSAIYLDVATLVAALMGGTIGFLWYNAFPAEVIMGDTGSFALGGALAGLAVVTGTEILLLLIGGIFVIEVLSLIIQVISYKRTGRRVFLMAPIHHHFEMKAWSETKVMVRFWVVCAIFCACGFALFYRDFLRFVAS